MPALDDRRYKISEVSEIVDVPVHILRQWESRVKHLKPKRDRGNHRYYTLKDIDIARRIKHLLRHEKMTLKGAEIQIGQEIYGEGRPKTDREAIELLDTIESEVRAMLELLDAV